MKKPIQELRYHTISTPQGDIKFLCNMDADQSIVTAYYAATVSLSRALMNTKFLTDDSKQKLGALISVHAVFICTYFIYGAGWGVDEDAMTDEERELWEEAGRQSMDKFQSLDVEQMWNVIQDIQTMNNKMLQDELILEDFMAELEEL